MGRNGVIVHDEIEIIEPEDKQYYLSTEITVTASGTFYCRAKLGPAEGGNPYEYHYYKLKEKTKNQWDVEHTIQQCVDACIEKMWFFEKARLTEINIDFN